MKKYLFIIFLSFLISSSASARKVGCKEGNCENGYGLWVSTDGTTYEGEWTGTKKNGQGIETWPNGYIYKGEFKNSEWSGRGTLIFPNSNFLSTIGPGESSFSIHKAVCPFTFISRTVRKS